MASRDIFILLILCVFAVKANSFVKVDCVAQAVVELDHQSMLNCIIKPNQGIKDVNVVAVVWKKIPDQKTVLYFKTKESFNTEPGYRFAEPSWSEENLNVSLLITSTKLADEGEYTCHVQTDSGTDKKKTSLKVTARYNEPKVILIDEKDIPNANKALICRAQGGYPAGRLRWFDENKNEWTTSADLKVETMSDGLFELSSKLPLLPGSTFSEYTCVVYNSTDGKEHEIRFRTGNPEEMGGGKPTDPPTSNIVAPVVVIGSLIVGLLIALLIYKRRSNQIRRPSATPFLDPSRQLPTDELDDGAGHMFIQTV